ncbi:MAG TPA: DUF892 family protein [Bacteroidia bacterium]|nr:DUF892 family protein [Bacteroidia bacterium]
MRNLFVRHLQTMYDGEMVMADALTAMSRSALPGALQNFYRRKAEEHLRTMHELNRVFRLLRTESKGECDTIIRSVVAGVDPNAVNEEDAIRVALALSGRALSVYEVSAYSTAVSCAMDLGEMEVAAIINKCLEEKKFNRANIEFLVEQDQLRMVREEFSFRENQVA